MIAVISGAIKKSVLDKKDGSGQYTLTAFEGLPLMFLSKAVTDKMVDGDCETFSLEIAVEKRTTWSQNGIDLGRTETVMVAKGIQWTEKQKKRYLGNPEERERLAEEARVKKEAEEKAKQVETQETENKKKK